MRCACESGGCVECRPEDRSWLGHDVSDFNSVLDELQHLPVSDGGSPDSAALVHGDAFGKAGPAIRPRIGNEGRDDTVIDAPDVDAPMKPGL